MTRRAALGLLGLVACSATPLPEIPADLADDPVLYETDAGYRRGVLERDLVLRDNNYSDLRFAEYGLGTDGWDALPERDEPTNPLTVDMLRAVEGGAPLTFDLGSATTLVPASRPTTDAEWIALGRRVFFEYPLRDDRTYTALLAQPGNLEAVGFLVDDDELVGLRVVERAGGSVVRVGPTCAQCHASEVSGQVSGVLANRRMDVGQARIRADLDASGELPPELDSTHWRDLDRLGAGRADVLGDDTFNPYAFPDFGGIVDMPRLHHNANWLHTGTATLAVRCETLFITSNGGRTRIPRVLSWALARYLRSLPPPPPAADPGPESEGGEQIFEAAGCAGCHVPPLYTSAEPVSVDVIGTDPSAANSPSRFSSAYRVPSLRGVGSTAPYLHHGAFADLESMFDPSREEPGHRFGLDLDDADRATLIAWLRTL